MKATASSEIQTVVFPERFMIMFLTNGSFFKDELLETINDVRDIRKTIFVLIL